MWKQKGLVPTVIDHPDNTFVLRLNEDKKRICCIMLMILDARPGPPPPGPACDGIAFIRFICKCTGVSCCFVGHRQTGHCVRVYTGVVEIKKKKYCTGTYFMKSFKLPDMETNQSNKQMNKYYNVLDCFCTVIHSFNSL